MNTANSSIYSFSASVFLNGVTVLVANCNIHQVLLKSKPALTVDISTGVHTWPSSYIKICNLHVSSVKTCWIYLPSFLYHHLVWDTTAMYHLQKTSRHMSDSYSKTRLAKRCSAYSKPIILVLIFTVVKFLQCQRWTVM